MIRYSPRGPEGQKYLASSIHIGMRLWEEGPGEQKAERRREYETVGYVVAGRAELTVEGQTVALEPGDSWVVPHGVPTPTASWRTLSPSRPPTHRLMSTDAISGQRGSAH